VETATAARVAKVVVADSAEAIAIAVRAAITETVVRAAKVVTAETAAPAATRATVRRAAKAAVVVVRTPVVVEAPRTSRQFESAAKAALFIAAGFLALFALRQFWREHERAAGLDFYIYFVAGQLADRDDIDNVYSAEVQSRVGEEYFERAQQSGSEIRKYDATRRRRLDNVSSPFLYSTMRWVSRDYERALWQYHVLVLAAFIAGTLLLCRRAGLRWWVALLLLAGLLLFYRGFEADLRVGNVNSLQLFALAVALWSPPLLAGAIMGMLVCFNPMSGVV
jgi:hypothetical protein